jgi:hypothetical protein
VQEDRTRCAGKWQTNGGQVLCQPVTHQSLKACMPAGTLLMTRRPVPQAGCSPGDYRRQLLIRSAAGAQIQTLLGVRLFHQAARC